MTDILRPLESDERFHIHTIPLYLVDRLQKAYDLRVFIETGTYLGFTVEQVVDQFDRIMTIELDPKLAANAQWKFKGHTHVYVLAGDAQEMLPRALDEVVAHRALVWLDAHWSGGITARGTTDTAILGELNALMAAPRRDHVLMIDDIVEFTGENGYPTVDELIRRVKEINPGYSINIDMTLRRGVLVALPPQ